MTTQQSLPSKTGRPLPSAHPSSLLTLREEIVRASVERMLAQALEVEAELHISRHRDLRNDSGKRLVVRNGYLPTREVACGAGVIRVHQPRVNDGRVDAHGRRTRYTSNVLPAYSRSAACIGRPPEDAVYRGLATGDMGPAFEAAFGAIQGELPPSFVPRLGELWEADRDRMSRRSHQGRDYAEVWADSMPAPAGVPGGEHALVLAATTPDGIDVLEARLGRADTTASWEAMVDGLVRRGFVVRPDRLRGEAAPAARIAFTHAGRR